VAVLDGCQDGELRRGQGAAHSSPSFGREHTRRYSFHDHVGSGMNATDADVETETDAIFPCSLTHRSSSALAKVVDRKTHPPAVGRT